MTDDRDERRKLTPLDYMAIRFAVNSQGRTIREVANSYGCSTKYVKRLVSQTVMTNMTQMTVCSGCLYTFSDDELQQHYAVWTSGGTKELGCVVMRA